MKTILQLIAVILLLGIPCYSQSGSTLPPISNLIVKGDTVTVFTKDAVDRLMAQKAFSERLQRSYDDLLKQREKDIMTMDAQQKTIADKNAEITLKDLATAIRDERAVATNDLIFEFKKENKNLKRKNKILGGTALGLLIYGVIKTF